MSTTRGDAKDFDRWQRRMVKHRIPGWAGLVFKKVFIQVGDAMVMGTPVGDADYWKNPPPPGYTGGRARGSWQPSIGSPKTDDPGRIDARGSAPLAEGDTVGAMLKLGDRAFWTANVPYILRLVHGWSRQAPDGWVPRNLRQIANQFRR